MQHRQMFHIQLRLQQLMYRCNNKIQCLRKRYLLARHRQEVEVAEVVEEEEEEEVAEEALLLEKIVSKYR